MPAFEELAVANSALREGHNHQGTWSCEWIFENKPDAADLSARILAHIQAHDLVKIDIENWNIAPIDADTNWLEKSYQGFPPFSVGPFFIYGSHCEDQAPEGQIGLQIDAATAFGSGEHGTTKGCLRAMLDIKGRGVCPWNVLDLGTGSGILAIAAWKLWHTPILATDIDDESVRVAAHHCDLNGVKIDKMSVWCAAGDGASAAIVQDKKPYELVIANILAAPLKEMANDIVEVIDTNGYIILSGMLNEQAASVQGVYEALGLSFKQRYDIGEWTTLALQK